MTEVFGITPEWLIGYTLLGVASIFLHLMLAAFITRRWPDLRASKDIHAWHYWIWLVLWPFSVAFIVCGFARLGIALILIAVRYSLKARRT